MLNKIINIKNFFIKNFKPARNNLEVLSDDIFIVSYPRSGNTWLRFLIGPLLTGKKIDFLNMDSLVPDIYRVTENFLSKMKRPRLLKSHNRHDPRYPTVIYILRKPHEIVISQFYFLAKFNKININKGNFDLFFDNFIYQGFSDFGSYKDHAISWLKNKNQVENGFFLIKYEDLVKDTFKEIKKLAHFLKCQASDESIKKYIEWASLENMIKLEKKQENQSSLLNKTNKNIPFVKASDSAHAKLNPISLNYKQSEILDKLYSEILKFC